MRVLVDVSWLSRLNERLEESFDWSVDHLLPYVALATLVAALLIAVFVG